MTGQTQETPNAQKGAVAPLQEVEASQEALEKTAATLEKEVAISKNETLQKTTTMAVPKASNDKSGIVDSKAVDSKTPTKTPDTTKIPASKTPAKAPDNKTTDSKTDSGTAKEISISEKLHTPPSSRPGTASSKISPKVSPKASPARGSVEVNNTKPQDFAGEVATNDDLPSDETQRKIQDYVVLDRHGKSHTFKSLYSGRNVARRVLVIFVRHFYCGYCQQYMKTLTESITPDMLLELPIPTFIAVVGCGDPALIDMYAQATNCPFPIYTDPTRALYDALGMVRTLTFGAKPAYVRTSFTGGILGSVGQALKAIPKGLVTRGGDARQVGGEFMFEPLTASAPLVGRGFGPDEVGGGSRGEDNLADQEERRKRSVGEPDEADDDESVIEEKRMTWCHRMRTTRDHVEIPELMEILGLAGHGRPIKDLRRWSKAMDTRKGTGVTLAKEMGEMRRSISEGVPVGVGVVGGDVRE